MIKLKVRPNLVLQQHTSMRVGGRTRTIDPSRGVGSSRSSRASHCEPAHATRHRSIRKPAVGSCCRVSTPRGGGGGGGSSPVVAHVGRHADAGRVVPAGLRMVVAVGQPLVAEVPGPARSASALPGRPAGTLLAAGVPDALGAVRPGVAHAAPAAVWLAAVPEFSAAARRAYCCWDTVEDRND